MAYLSDRLICSFIFLILPLLILDLLKQKRIFPVCGISFCKLPVKHKHQQVDRQKDHLHRQMKKCRLPDRSAVAAGQQRSKRRSRKAQNRDGTEQRPHFPCQHLP